jgi:hypothetical protein
MKMNNYRASLIAVAVASMLYASSPALAALPLAMTGRGSGTETGLADSCDGSGNSCNGSNCICYTFSGTGTATGIGAVTFQTNLLVFVGLVDNLACAGASGVLPLTQKTNSGNVLMLDYQGLSCLDSAALVFNGSYSIDGTKSLGKFAGAMGSGRLTGSVDGSSTLTIGNLSGTLLLHH